MEFKMKKREGPVLYQQQRQGKTDKNQGTSKHCLKLTVMGEILRYLLSEVTV